MSILISTFSSSLIPALFCAAGTSSSSELPAPQTNKQSTAPVNQQLTELDADELLTYKRRLLELLQPHETVLTALRRLGGRLEGGQGGADAMPWKRSRKSAGGFPCLLEHGPLLLKTCPAFQLLIV